MCNSHNKVSLTQVTDHLPYPVQSPPSAPLPKFPSPLSGSGRMCNSQNKVSLTQVTDHQPYPVEGAKIDSRRGDKTHDLAHLAASIPHSVF